MPLIKTLSRHRRDCKWNVAREKYQEKKCRRVVRTPGGVGPRCGQARKSGSSLRNQRLTWNDRHTSNVCAPSGFISHLRASRSSKFRLGRWPFLPSFSPSAPPFRSFDRASGFCPSSRDLLPPFSPLAALWLYPSISIPFVYPSSHGPFYPPTSSSRSNVSKISLTSSGSVQKYSASPKRKIFIYTCIFQWQFDDQ